MTETEQGVVELWDPFPQTADFSAKGEDWNYMFWKYLGFSCLQNVSFSSITTFVSKKLQEQEQDAWGFVELKQCIWLFWTDYGPKDQPRYGLDETNQFWSFWSPKCLACLLYLNGEGGQQPLLETQLVVNPSICWCGKQLTSGLEWQWDSGFVSTFKVFNKIINGPDNSFHWKECYPWASTTIKTMVDPIWMIKALR